jgi:hypothetical protein
VNLDLDIRSPKLAHKFIGPFQIIDRVGEVAYKLELPPTYSKIHPVFHVSKLRLHKDDHDQFPSRVQAASRPPAVTDNNEQEEWEVERIVSHRERGRGRKKRLEYLVLWKGYEDYERTWQSEDDVKNAKNKVKEYWNLVQT